MRNETLPLDSNYKVSHSSVRQAQRLATSIRAVIESLENRCLLSASVGTAAAADLTGTFSGDMHVGRLPAGFLGATAAVKPHTLPTTLNLTEGANGLLAGTLTVGPSSSTLAATFNVQGLVRGHSFDAVIWQGSGPVSAATSVGKLTGSISAKGNALHGAAIETISGHSVRGSFRLTSSAAIGSTPSGISQAVNTSVSATSVADLTGTVRIHAARNFGATLARNATAATQGFSIDVTSESADGLLGGTFLVQNLGAFNFVGLESRSVATLIFDGAAGSGSLTAHVGANNFSWTGTLVDSLDGKILTGKFRATNSAVTSSAALTGSNSSGNTSTTGSGSGTNVGLGLGGTPVNTTTGIPTGTPTVTGANIPGLVTTTTTTTTTTNNSGVGTGIGGTPGNLAGTGSATGSSTGVGSAGTLSNGSGFLVGTPGSPGTLGGSIGTGAPSIGDAVPTFNSGDALTNSGGASGVVDSAGGSTTAGSTSGMGINANPGSSSVLFGAPGI